MRTARRQTATRGAKRAVFERVAARSPFTSTFLRVGMLAPAVKLLGSCVGARHVSLTLVRAGAELRLGVCLFAAMCYVAHQRAV